MGGSIKILSTEEAFDGKDFEVQFCKCSYEKCLSNKLPETGRRIYYSVHMVMNGVGWLESGGDRVKLKRNDLFVVFPGEEQSYYPDPSNPWSYIWVDLMGKDIESLLRMCGTGPELPYKTVRDSEIPELFQALLNTYNTADSSLFECSVRFMAILAKLLKENAAARGSDQFVSQKNLVREAIIFISNNYRLNITLADVAAAIGVSKSYLVSLFAKEAKIAPMKYLMLYRIASASELLAKGDLNVNEVSREVGFNDPLYFSRCFSAVKGKPPRDYAKHPDGDPWEFFKKNNIDYR